MYSEIIEKFKTGQFNFSNVYDPNQYFNDVFENSLVAEEVYVDAGAYDGADIFKFIGFTNNMYKKIYAFEPDLLNYWKTCSKFQYASAKIELINDRLADFNGEVSFNSRGDSASRIDEDGNRKIKVYKLDDVVKDKITFLKMDIEGAEYSALMGSQNVIKKDKPKLAISIYHRPEDLWHLPLLIHEMVSEYKFYIRHHDRSLCETVLYAKVG